MPEVVTPGIGKAEEAFKRVVWDTAVESALTSIGINFFPLNIIAKRITNALYEAMRLVVDFRIIAFMNHEQRVAFDRESANLKKSALQNGIDSPEFRKANENAQKAFADFVGYNYPKRVRDNSSHS